MRFVLTGGAVIDGIPVKRKHIVENLLSIGDTVVDGFESGADVLVASRSDTRKAAAARALGKPVWTYKELYDHYVYVSERIARVTIQKKSPVATVAPAAGTRALIL